jgi:ADP-heptose:LPS heptosyltransferase
MYDEAGYGDTLLVGAVAREIKEQYGNVHITVNRVKEELLAHNPYVDTTGQRYDGIDLNYHYTVNNHHTPNPFTENLIEVMCIKTGIRNPSHTVDMFLTEEENDYAQKQIESAKTPVITIHTTSDSFDNGRKLWPVEYWEELVSMLKKKECSVIQLGSSGEQNIKGTVDLTGKLGIRHSIAVVKAANLHIGIVSSLMHGAAATGTEAIILFGGFERYSLHDYKNIHPIESHIECSPCIQPYTKMEKCPLDNRCMREISPEIVFRKTAEVLKWK